MTERAPTRAAWTALALLYLVYLANIADRHILSILAQEVKLDLELSDTQIGLLIGPAIALLYAVIGVPLSYIADRVNRRNFLAASLAMWSVFTALGGLASNVWQLAASRIGVSAAEAGGTPASASILADLFPVQRRALAMGIFGSASAAGVFVSFAVGGWIGHHYGWRAALLCAGVPGILLSVALLLFLKEPERGAMDDGSSDAVMAPSRLSIVETVRHLLSIPVYRQALFAVSSLQLAISTTLSWGPAFIIRKFDMNASAVGATMGLGIALIGGSCFLLSGFMIDRIGRKGLPKAFRAVALFQSAGLIFFATALTANNFLISALAFSALYGVMHFYAPAYYMVSQGFVPASMRATGLALGVLCMTVIGQGLTPPAVGLLSDLLKPQFGEASLGLAMAPVALGILISTWQFFRVAKLVEMISPNPIKIA